MLNILPAGSLNQAIFGPFPRIMPLLSVFIDSLSYCMSSMPFSFSSSAASSILSTGMLSIVNSAGTWFGLGINYY